MNTDNYISIQKDCYTKSLANKEFKIHAICAVKDEVDIISKTLLSALEWCDYLYIYENGSNDGTAEIIVDLTKKYNNIFIFRQDSLPFITSIRPEIYHYYMKNYRAGDWICLLDADEIYIDNPKKFLDRVPSPYKVVKSASFQYYFTFKDAEAYNNNPSLYANDVPIELRCRYYLNNWSEYRFFKYEKGLKWKLDASWPTSRRRPVYPIRIRLKHYQYRSPQQINQRLENRLKLKSFAHEKQVNWRQTVLVPTKLNFSVSVTNTSIVRANDQWKSRLVDESLLYFDACDGTYVLREDLMPPLEDPVESLNLTKRGLNKISRFIEKLIAFIKL